MNLHIAIWPGAVVNTQDIPGLVPHLDRIVSSEGEVMHNGGSAAANPDGSWLLEPQADVEDVFVVELERGFVDRER